MKSMKEIFRTLLLIIKQIYLYLRSIYYIGNKLVCPCCGGHFRKFLTFGVIPRPNARCPRCGSLERHRLFWLYYEKRTNLFTDKLKVLHFAPEFIFQKKLSSLPNLDYTSADLKSPRAMEKMDITNIQFQDNSFDAILCNDVLEHIPDDQKAISELFRVLKPDGWAIIQSPVDQEREQTFEDPSIVRPEERERMFGRSDHVRIYGQDYVARLEKAGFTVEADDYANESDPDNVKKYGLKTDRKIYFCTK